MLEQTAEDYSKYLDVDLDQKLAPINQTVSDLLTRLEEVETMASLLKEERCTAMGSSGALTNCMDLQPQFKELCQRIDTLESLVEHLKSYVNQVANKLSDAEEKFGITDSGGIIKNFIKTSLFKKTSESPKNENAPLGELSVANYFHSDAEDA